MKTNKLLGVILCIVILLVTIIGCTSSNSSSTTKTNSIISNDTNKSKTEKTTEVGEPDPFRKYEDPITITVARSIDPNAQFDESDPEKKSYAENRWIDTYLEKLGINVEFKWIASDADSNSAKWSTAVASGDVPDTAVVNTTIYKMLLESGLIADMTDIYEQYASDDYKDGISEINIQQMWFDDALRGLPYAQKAYMGATVLFIREDWLDALGLDIPETIDDVIAVAKAFQDADLGGGNTIGLLFGDGTTSEGKWDGFMNGFGAYYNYWVKDGDNLVYSNTQEQMKDALLAMQSLYKNGIMNKDFAVTTEDVAREYVASGKVGIFYSTAWNTTSSIQGLYDNDENARIINIYPPSVNGEPIPIQTNSPGTTRIFVSSKCKNPEAIAKLINLSIKLPREDYNNYGMDKDGFMWFKYMVPASDLFCPATYDIDVANAIRVAEETGERNFIDVPAEGFYESYLLAKEGKAQDWWLLTFGPGGSYTTLYDAYQKGLHLVNAFNGLPTDTMTLKGGVIDENLRTAMIEVIMGEDISVYEKAIEDWYVNGGQEITDEVNEWYQSIK